MSKTHYDNLQVTRNASPEVIKGAYKYLTQKWHPDKNPDNRAEADRILKIINRAYEVLSDPQLRKEHDDWIEQQERESSASRASAAGRRRSLAEDLEKTIDVSRQSAIRLWNPNAAANWSLLFSPIFGAWLHAKNWTALGEKGRASRSMLWVYVGGVVLIAASLLSEKAVPTLGFGYLVGWYFSSAKSQVKYIKETIGGEYVKRGWFKPLGVAVISLAALSIAVGFVVSAIDPDIIKMTAADEISGVWKINNEKTVVTFQLTSIPSVVKVNESVIPVTVDKFDSGNKVLTLLVRNDPSTVWSVRQLFDNAGHFALQMTLEDGEQVNLSFIRNL